MRKKKKSSKGRETAAPPASAPPAKGPAKRKASGRAAAKEPPAKAPTRGATSSPDAAPSAGSARRSKSAARRKRGARRSERADSTQATKGAAKEVAGRSGSAQPAAKRPAKEAARRSGSTQPEAKEAARRSGSAEPAAKAPPPSNRPQSTPAQESKEAPRRTQRQRREATRQRLIAATIESLLEVGYGRTSAQVICRRAGLSHGGLFRVFPTILDLVLASAQEVARRQIEEFERQFAKVKKSGDPIPVALSLLREICRSEMNTVFYELAVAARTDNDLRRALARSMSEYYDAIREAALRVPGMDTFTPEVREVLLFTAIHLFDGEALARRVLPQPETEDKRLELLTLVVSAARPRS